MKTGTPNSGGFPAYDPAGGSHGIANAALELIFGPVHRPQSVKQDLSFAERPYPASVLPRGEVTELRELLARHHDLTDAVSSQTATEQGLHSTEKAVASARKKLRVLFFQEQRSRHMRSDAHLQQVKVISDEMDALEAEACELGLGGMEHQCGHFDPVAFGGWRYFRGETAIYPYPDGRRMLRAPHCSEYERERQRKVELGLLEAS